VIGLRTRVATAVALVACAAGACGIPLDDGARPISVGSGGTTDQQATSSGGDTTSYLYFVKNDRLVDVTRDVPERDVKAVVDALFAGPTAAETANGLITQIPAGAALQQVTRSGDTTTIEVSKQLLDVIGVANQQAIGQIVLTVTEIEPASTVEFIAGGQPLKVSSPSRGDVSQVSDCDYLSLFPTDDELREANLSEDSRQHIAARRRNLTDRCPDVGGTPS